MFHCGTLRSLLYFEKFSRPQNQILNMDFLVIGVWAVRACQCARAAETEGVLVDFSAVSFARAPIVKYEVSFSKLPSHYARIC